ncbi:MAG TPA: hypothetical protein PK575_06420 [Syntrophorhabdus sp.]|nr:hypothetical protein [Pseudomonadota bacterium]HQI96344.1 hypothetical protein [Syntrophorhabdus sp.]
MIETKKGPIAFNRGSRTLKIEMLKQDVDLSIDFFALFLGTY